MKSELNTEQEKDFREELSNPARQAFEVAGYERLEQFTEVTAREVLNLHGVGPKTIRQLRELLAARGMSFAGE